MGRQAQLASSIMVKILPVNPSSSCCLFLSELFLFPEHLVGGWRFEAFLLLLSLQRPWKPKDKWPKEAAEVNYTVGLCSLELRNFLQAHDAFNNAIDIDKKYAEAYYQRGVCSLSNLRAQLVATSSYTSTVVTSQLLTHHAMWHLISGVTKLRLKQSKGIQDINRALALDRTIFQAYLTRASYYGARGQVGSTRYPCTLINIHSSSHSFAVFGTDM